MLLAQIVTVWLVFIQGPDTLYPSEFIDNIEPQIQAAYLEAGVAVVFKKHLVYLGNFPQPDELNPYGYHRKIGRLARELKLLRRNRIVHFVVPHSLNGYMVGAANNNCYRKNRLSYGYATAQEYNINGEYRLNHSALGAVHEIGHMMDADHVSSRSVMNTAVLHLYNQYGPLPWDKRSVKQINNCVNWKRR